MWSEKARSWRKNKKRAVSPIIATILLVAITVVLAAVLYILISGLTKGPGNTPLGTALAIGSPIASQAGTNYWENFSIESAGSQITWNSVNLEVINAAGTPVGTVTSYTVLPLGSSGTTTVCTATGAQETSWTAGTAGSGTTQISSTQILVVKFSANPAGQGDILRAIGVGSFQGTVNSNIP